MFREKRRLIFFSRSRALICRHLREITRLIKKIVRALRPNALSIRDTKDRFTKEYRRQSIMTYVRLRLFLRGEKERSVVLSMLNFGVL